MTQNRNHEESLHYQEMLKERKQLLEVLKGMQDKLDTQAALIREIFDKLTKSEKKCHYASPMCETMEDNWMAACSPQLSPRINVISDTPLAANEPYIFSPMNVMATNHDFVLGSPSSIVKRVKEGGRIRNASKVLQSLYMITYHKRNTKSKVKSLDNDSTMEERAAGLMLSQEEDVAIKSFVHMTDCKLQV
ncbi:uncharacterized protein LOC131244508 isoform X1 [Magnolia sinica]|uniref:uncharacterized protein LOC131244508 isoform X1 n=1 Tax=Magnolia sinica TaxID=86752 RepID=UPI00265B4624|nr:uncharacterized protein LOC131244508 isoform X1 [Magnolia sinica]